MKKAFILLLSVLFSALSCAVNPLTGKKELSLISENQEIALGKQLERNHPRASSSRSSARPWPL